MGRVIAVPTAEDPGVRLLLEPTSLLPCAEESCCEALREDTGAPAGFTREDKESNGSDSSHAEKAFFFFKEAETLPAAKKTLRNRSGADVALVPGVVKASPEVMKNQQQVLTEPIKKKGPGLSALQQKPETSCNKIPPGNALKPVWRLLHV